jgi:phenylalanine-4-hydroxylase
MRTPYVIDDFQQAYFVIDTFETLLEATLETDFGPLYEALAQAEDLCVGAVEPDDQVYSHRKQA